MLSSRAWRGCPSCRVVCCGHSLGAALATLGAFWAQAVRFKEVRSPGLGAVGFKLVKWPEPFRTVLVLLADSLLCATVAVLGYNGLLLLPIEDMSQQMLPTGA